MATGNIMASKEQELVLTRVFDAPRELVFKARTDPKQVAQVGSPRVFYPVCELDLRPGAAIRIHKRGPDGTVYPMTGDHEIVKPERLVFTSAALGADGSPLFEVLTTMTFAERKWQNETNYLGARYKDDGPGRPVYCWDGAGLDSEPGVPRRIPGKDLTAEERKMPRCLHDGGCPNPDKASQDRAIRGLEADRDFA